MTQGNAGGVPKAMAKALLRSLAFLVMVPFILWFYVFSALFPSGRDRLMRGMSQLFSLVPGTTGSYLRCAFYRRTFVSVGQPCYIGFGTIFATADVSIGDRVYIGPFCNLGHVDIEDDVLLGSNVTVLSGSRQHGFERIDVPINRQPGTFERVRIERDCWLGNGAILMTDLHSGCIVAAGATVTRTAPPLSILGGNPAEVIRSRTGESQR